MFYKDLISVALAAVLGTTVVFAIEHGEVTEISGEEYRWHQIAKDVWTGVPIREWDEDVHTRSDMDIDLAYVVNRDAPSSWGIEDDALARDLDELESRQIADVCDFVISCSKDTREGCTLINGLDALVKAIKFAWSSDKDKQIWEFLVKHPITARFLEGNITLNLDYAGSAGDTPDECSAADDQAGFVQRMLSTAVKKLPKAFSLSYDFEADGRKFTVTLNSAAVGNIPVTRPGECTDQIDV